MRRSPLLGHLMGLWRMVWRAEKQAAFYVTTLQKPQHWPRIVENDGFSAGPFFATQFTELAKIYGPLINPEGPLPADVTPPLPAGTRVRVTGPNIWNETEDEGRVGHVTRVDVVGDYGVQFDDDLAPLGSYFTLANLEVLS